MAIPNHEASGLLAHCDVLGLIGDAVICTDDDGKILAFNRAAEEAFGYSASEVMGRDIQMLLPARYRVEHSRHMREFASRPDAANHLMGERREVWGLRKNGEEFPSEAMVSRHSQDGQAILTVVHREISERKKSEEISEAIRRELDHRIKNVFSLVSALLQISARDADSVEELRKSLTDRLRALARTQAVLHGENHQSTNLAEIVHSELNEYISENGTAIDIIIPDISVSPTSARLLALVIHELATNSVKYGALSTGRGNVAFSATPSNHPAEPSLVLRWRESSAGSQVGDGTKGFGTDLIRQIVRRGLGGAVAWEYTASELLCIISIPIGSAVGIKLL